MHSPVRLLSTACVLFLLSASASQEKSEPEKKPGPLTPEQQTMLTERDRLKTEFMRLDEKPRKDDADRKRAVELLAGIVKIEKEVLGTHFETAQSLTFLGRVLEELEEFKTAGGRRQEARDLLQVLFPETHREHWRVTEARLAVQHLELLDKMTADELNRYRALKELDQKIHVARQEKRWKDGIDLARQLRDGTKALLGVSHRDYSISTQTLAVFLDLGGKPDEAEPVYREALDLRRRLLGTRHPFFADTCTDLASLLNEREQRFDSQSKYKEAQSVRKEILDLLVEAYGPKDWRVTDAKLLREMYDIKASWSEEDKKRFQQFDKQYRKAERLLAEMNDEEVIPLAKEIMNGVTALFPPRHRYLGIAKNLLALSYEIQGDLPAAKQVLEDGLKDNQATLGVHPDTGQALENLARVEWQLKDIAASYRHYQEAKQIFDQCEGKDLRRYWQLLNNYAIFLERIGDLDASANLMIEARTVADELRPTEPQLRLTTLGYTAVLRQRQKRFGEAEKLFLEVRAEYGRAPKANPKAYLTLLHNLASFYAEVGRRAAGQGLREKAAGLFREGEKIAREVIEKRLRLVPANHPETRETRNLLAVLVQNQGRLEEAESIFLSLRDTFESQELYEREVASNLSPLYQFMKFPEKALFWARKSIEGEEQFLKSALDGLSGRQRIAFLESLRDTLNGYLSVALAAGAPSSEMYEHVLLWKGAVFARGAEERLLRDHPKLAPLHIELEKARFRYAWVATSEPAPSRRPAWRKTLGELKDKKEALERRFSEAITDPQIRRQLEQAAPFRRISAADVSNALPEQYILLDFLHYTHFSPPEGVGPLRQERRLVVFVLQRGAPPVCVSLGSYATVHNLVLSWQKALHDRFERTTPQDRRALADAELINLPEELASVLLPKLKERLQGAAALIVAPDGALCRFPFAILPGSKKNRYMIQDFPIGYVTSGRHAADVFTTRGKNQNAEGAGFLGVGGIDYGHMPGESPVRSGLTPLPDTLDEVQTCADLYEKRFGNSPRPALLSGEAPNKERSVEAFSGGRRYIHWAGHAFFGHPLHFGGNVLGMRGASGPDTDLDQDGRVLDPFLFSGILLAGANSRGVWYDLGNTNSFTLTAEEINGMDLRRTRLVTLSACQTGLGVISSGGEGVLGLQRSFHQAGVPTLVTSLWQVPSGTTNKLMKRFYANLWSEDPCGPLQAMRQAQLDILKSPVGDTEHYYYWAAWVVSGDPGILARSENGHPNPTTPAENQPPFNEPRPSDNTNRWVAGLAITGLFMSGSAIGLWIWKRRASQGQSKSSRHRTIAE